MTKPLQLFNTPLDLRTFYENSIIKDSPDPNETYVLFNQAKDIIEELYKLKINESYDESQVFSPGDTYLTMHNLPDDWRSTIKIILGPASGSSVPQLPCYPIPFRRRDAFQRVMNKYYIDAKNNKFAITGSTGSSMLIKHWYRCFNNQMSVSTENQTDVINWPNRFWIILAYAAGAIRNGSFDADAMAFRLSIEQQQVYDSVLDALISWDQDLKLEDMNHQGGYSDDIIDSADDDYGGPYNYNVGTLG